MLGAAAAGEQDGMNPSSFETIQVVYRGGKGEKVKGEESATGGQAQHAVTPH